MTPQEREQLTQFLKQLADVRAGEKNAEADALIREAAARQPDAAYLLVQRAMLVEQALNAAKAQIAQLQGQLQAQQGGGRGAGSFLGGGNPWALDAAPPAPAGVPGAGNYQTPRGGAMFNAAPAPAPSGGGAGSFLGNVATTAAGVVAGSFLFQGLESLLGGHHASPSSLWGDAGAGEHVAEQTIINNYYDSAPDERLAQGGGWSQPDDVADFLAEAEDDTGTLSDDGDDSDWA